MDRNEFDRLVNQYPVARSSQYRRGWAAAAADGADGSASPAAASPVPAALPVVRSPPAAAAASSAAKSSPPPVASSSPAAASSASAATAGAPSGDFFSSLTAHLRSSFSDELTRAIVERFRTAHSAALGSLSLDDMETVAASMRRPLDCARQQAISQQPSASPAPVEHADLMVD